MLNATPPFMFWQRSAIKEVNDWALSRLAKKNLLFNSFLKRLFLFVKSRSMIFNIVLEKCRFISLITKYSYIARGRTISPSHFGTTSRSSWPFFIWPLNFSKKKIFTILFLLLTDKYFIKRFWYDYKYVKSTSFFDKFQHF